ncbi:MAG: helix-turn-helix domain-containing protein [Alphaproteobacteria bacterium]
MHVMHSAPMKLYLREYRKRAGLTLQQVAVRLGLSYTQMSRIERGISGFPAARLDELAAIYGCHPADFFKNEQLDRAVPLISIPFLRFTARDPVSPTQSLPKAERHFQFDRRFLDHFLAHTAPTELALVQIPDDAMHPTVGRGDVVIADLSIRKYVGDGLYLLMGSSGWQLRRLVAHPSEKKFVLSADNPAHPQFTNLAPAGVIIRGRALFVLRQL